MKLEGRNTRWLTADFRSGEGLAAWICWQQKARQLQQVLLLGSALGLPQTSGGLALTDSDSKRGDEILVGEIVVGRGFSSCGSRLAAAWTQDSNPGSCLPRLVPRSPRWGGESVSTSHRHFCIMNPWGTDEAQRKREGGSADALELPMSLPGQSFVLSLLPEPSR